MYAVDPNTNDILPILRPVKEILGLTVLELCCNPHTCGKM